jgi:serine/threonine protein kinase
MSTPTVPPVPPIELTNGLSPLTQPNGCHRRFVPVRLLQTNRGTGAQVVLCYDVETRGYAVGKASRLDANFVENPRDEVDMGYRFADSDFFPNVLGAAEIKFGNRMWLVAYFEYCGDDLFDFISKNQPMSPLVARMVFAQIVAAMSVMHAEGVTHQDLKPENFLVRSDGHITVCDLGQARTGDYLTGMFGTHSYRAPEQGFKATFNAKAADVYSLGLILFVMMSGTMPPDMAWRRTVSPHQMDHYLRVNFTRQENGVTTPIFDADARHLICGMLASNPSNRFTVAHVADHAWMQN